MATIVIVGNRDAALEAAMQLGHDIVLVSDRKIGKKRRATVLAAIEADFSLAHGHVFTKHCSEQMRAVTSQLPERVEAVIGVTERAVLPAAWLRSHFGLEGVSAESAYLCRNKLAMKRRVQACGVDCSEFAPVTGRTTAAGLVRHLGLPLVLKPVDSSGSRGATVARQQRDVASVLQPGMLAESFVHGIEMSVEAFVHAGEVQFTNLTEYLVPLWSNIVPATVPEETRAAVTELNHKVIAALGINRGMTHMEVFITPAGPVFSEIALRPPGGYLMELMNHAYGFNSWHAFLQTELGQPVQFPRSAVQSAGVVLLHPGEGRVTRIAGLGEASRVPGVLEVSCRVATDEALTRREGSGESAAHIVATGKTRTDVVRTLSLARRALVVELDHSATKSSISKRSDFRYQSMRSGNGKVQRNGPVRQGPQVGDPAPIPAKRRRAKSN